MISFERPAPLTVVGPQNSRSSVASGSHLELYVMTISKLWIMCIELGWLHPSLEPYWPSKIGSGCQLQTFELPTSLWRCLFFFVSVAATGSSLMKGLFGKEKKGEKVPQIFPYPALVSPH